MRLYVSEDFGGIASVSAANQAAPYRTTTAQALQGSRALAVSVYSLCEAFEILRAHDWSTHHLADLHRGLLDAPKH